MSVTNQDLFEVAPSHFMSYTDLTNKDRANLSRLAKGYLYEIAIQKEVDSRGLEYEANPIQYEQWKEHTNTGYDIKIKDPSSGEWIRVECKFTLTPLYHSWIERDWLSRSASIIVTNDKWNITYKDRRLLEKSGKKVLSNTEFIMYLDKLVRGNKYVVFEYATKLVDISRLDSSQNKTEVKLDKYLRLDSPISTKQDNKPREYGQYTCEECKRYEDCKIIDSLDLMNKIKPKWYGRQSYLDELDQKQEVTLYKDKYKEWKKNKLKLINEQIKCLHRRTAIARNNPVKYRLFKWQEDQTDSTSGQ